MNVIFIAGILQGRVAIHNGFIVMGGVNTLGRLHIITTRAVPFLVTKSARRITLLPAVAALLLLTGCTGQYRPYQVAGNSMTPLIAKSDHIFADESEQARTNVHDGDIIIFRRPDNGIQIKRVLTMPGETVEGKDRKLFRNGKQLTEPYLAPPRPPEEVAILSHAWKGHGFSHAIRIPT